MAKVGIIATQLAFEVLYLYVLVYIIGRYLRGETSLNKDLGRVYSEDKIHRLYDYVRGP